MRYLERACRRRVAPPSSSSSPRASSPRRSETRSASSSCPTLSVSTSSICASITSNASSVPSVITSRSWLASLVRFSRNADELARRHLGHLRRDLGPALRLGERREQALRARPDGLGEARQATFLEVDDPVGDVEDAIVVRDQHDRGPLLPGEVVHPVDDVAARLLVERRGRLVGEDDARAGAASARAIATRCFWPPESWSG